MSDEPSGVAPRLELWGGIESTVNRVGDTYMDQTELTGHAGRISDLDRFAQLEIRALRYPVLWERVAPNGLADARWDWSDERLARLCELRIVPIVGLVHHGSGPPDTSLVDPAFPSRLAEFAAAVAQRYPWIDAYTPVNEPLTTARFSGLYGHWYPHGRDGRTFVRALLTQCRAVVLAMRAVRRVNPRARLVQTDDLGKTFSTPRLQDQAHRENERRWLTFDLLCGRVGQDHELRPYLRRHGATDAELDWFRDNPCPPDVVGINTYLSSQRFLDEHLDRYPAEAHGGNGRETYADVLAARARIGGLVGVDVLLRETWDRYHLPVAVTEVHNGCTREEQMRWFVEVWRAAEAARREGVDVRAVTAWSLLGGFDWDQLVTAAHGHYEPGVFDVRSGEPRSTAMVPLLQDLAHGRTPAHPVLQGSGWWRRRCRFEYGVAVRDDGSAAPPEAVREDQGAGAPLLVVGDASAMTRAMDRVCALRGLPLVTVPTTVDGDSLRRAIREARPWAAVYAAEYGDVDGAALEPECLVRLNVEAPVALATACRRAGIPMLLFSSDLVFDGHRHGAPYLETDDANPISPYGHSRREAELRVMDSLPTALVARHGPLFSPWNSDNALTLALQSLDAGNRVVLPDDRCMSPTYLPDLLDAALDLLIDGERGIRHLANGGPVRWSWMIHRAAAMFGMPLLRPDLVSVQPSAGAPRPAFSALASVHGAMLPEVEDALTRYCADCVWRPRSSSPVSDRF